MVIMQVPVGDGLRGDLLALAKQQERNWRLVAADALRAGLAQIAGPRGGFTSETRRETSEHAGSGSGAEGNRHGSVEVEVPARILG